MNKKIKRIIAVALAVSAFSAIEPTKYMNLTTVKANAEIKGANLKTLSLEKGNIDFDPYVTAYNVTVDDSVDELAIRAKPKEDDAVVEINGTEVTSSDDDYKKVVKLDRGENTVNIKVQNGARKKTYTLTIIRGEKQEEKQIYLSDIILSNGDIVFSKEKTSYDVNVNSDVKEVSIKAKPEDTDYDVEINGITARDEDNYKQTVSLNTGKNEIKIKIEDNDDHEKIYTLNINRGGTSTAANTQASQTTGVVNGNTTNTVVKGWSSNNGQWYFYNDYGSKQTDWKQVNGAWYYLGTDGAMKTGWQQINNNWYFLDSNGAMKTGWLQNSDGKWYFLYDSGIMAKNTTVGGYKLDSNGACNS